MSYQVKLFPFRFRRLTANEVIAVSESGDHAFLTQDELVALVERPEALPIKRLADLKAKFFLGDPAARGSTRLLTSRIAAKRETVLKGPALHIFVLTLLCGHSCRYCQVSRALGNTGYTMSMKDLEAACAAIFESPSQTLTVEFQGGDPLICFDLIRFAVERILRHNETEGRDVRFVVASTLHQLNEEMCEFFAAHGVFLSTSLDGPAALHNRNRPTPARNAYERTVAGIQLARERISVDAVSALMTTTRDSLAYPEEIVDEYVSLGFGEVFLRILSSHGFARRNEAVLGYSLNEFHAFYERAFERVLHWNKKGVAIREVTASIVLNKILSSFDGGYVDLQSPTGSGLSVLVYNFDGYVYPSDEARMLAETGDSSMRLGRIGVPLESLLNSEMQRALIKCSLGRQVPGCRDCAYNVYCGPDPVDAYRQWGTFAVPAPLTEHCRHYMWLFDFLFKRLREQDVSFGRIAQAWAGPLGATKRMDCA